MAARGARSEGDIEAEEMRRVRRILLDAGFNDLGEEFVLRDVVRFKRPESLGDLASVAEAAEAIDPESLPALVVVLCREILALKSDLLEWQEQG